MKINSSLLFALFLLLVSLTIAIETSEHETINKEAKRAAETNKVEPAGGGGGNWGGGGGNWGGGGCRYGCCYRGYRGCQRCCASLEEAKAVAEKQETMKAIGAEEANKVEPEAKGAAETNKVEPAGGGGGNWGGGGGNWGGGGGNWGGGGCRYGCCYRGYRGCQRCCASLEELAKAVAEKQEAMKAKGAEEDKVEPEAKGAAETNKVEPAGGGGGNWGGGGGGGNWGGGGCRHGCCYRGYRGCQRCCASPEEAKALAGKQDTMSKEAKGATTEANKVEPEEKGAAEVNKVEPAGGGGGNWGGGGGGNWGGGGGGCRHGCCYRGYGGCQRCCSSPEEAKALAEKQLHP